MYPISIKQAAEWAGGTVYRGNGEEMIRNVVIDSRQAGPGDLFVALIGENHDAHKFIPMAAEQGCQAVLASSEEAVRDLMGPAVILAEDTLTAMQQLAKNYLATLPAKKIAVTGSVGKTSTRDFLYYTLKQRFRAGKPEKNLNNIYGVPLTIFSFDPELEVMVFEEGMERFGQIHVITDIIRPDAALITMIGISHLEHLGSRENIFRSKMQITDFFGPENLLVVNEDNDLLSREACSGNYRLMTIGEGETADIRVSDVTDLGDRGIEFTIHTPEESRRISLPIPGAHNAHNAALAYAGARDLGADLDDFQKGLLEIGGAGLTGHRLKVIQAGGIKVIDDSYNAAPDSVKSALRTLRNTEGRRKVAIIGNMNELGPDSREHHREVGRYAAELGTDIVIGIKEKAKDLADSAREGGSEAFWFEDKEQAISALPDILKEGDVVMIKASMTLHLWEIAEWIRDHYQA